MAVQRDKVIASAEKLVAKGKIEPAIKEYERLLDDNPNDVNTLNRIGDLWVRINRNDEAVKVFTKIADHYSKDGFFLKAIAIYKKINKLDPSKLDVYAKLADLYARQGLAMEAKSQYQVLADYYLKHGDPGNALGIYRKISELDPNSINVHVKLADLYSQNNQTAEALKEYDRVGRMLLKRGMLDEAVQVFRKALKIDASNVDLVDSLVTALLEAKDYENASQIVQQSLESNRDNPRLLAANGRIAMAKGDTVGARVALERGLAAQPDQVSIRENLAELYLKMNEPDRALEMLVPLVDKALARGEGRAGVEMLNRVLRVDSGHAPTLERLVGLYMKLNEETNILAAMNSLAEAHVARGRYEEAAGVLEKLIMREPQNAQHRNKLTFVKSQMGGVDTIPARGRAPVDIPMEVEEPAPSFEPEELYPAADDDLSLDLDASPGIELDMPSSMASDIDADMAAFEVPAPSRSMPSPARPVVAAPPPRIEPEPPAALDLDQDAEEDLDFITEHLTEAEVFAKYGLAEKAAEHLRAVIERSPRNVTAHDKLFRVLLDEGDVETARTAAAAYIAVLQSKGDTSTIDAVRGEFTSRGHAVPAAAPKAAPPRTPTSYMPTMERPMPRMEPEPSPRAPESLRASELASEDELSFDLDAPTSEFDLDSLPLEEPAPPARAAAPPPAAPAFSFEPEQELTLEPEPAFDLEMEPSLAFEDAAELHVEEPAISFDAPVPSFEPEPSPAFAPPSFDTSFDAPSFDAPAFEAPKFDTPSFGAPAFGGSSFEAQFSLEEPEAIAPPEPFFGAESLHPTVEGPAIEEIGEIDFYIEQELFEEARTKLDALSLRYPGNEELASRRARLDAAGGSAAQPAISPIVPPSVPLRPATLSRAEIESELLSAIPDDDDDYGLPAVPPPPPPRPAAAPEAPVFTATAAQEESLFADEDDFFDLAAELESELEEDEDVVSLSEEEQSLEEIFKEFKKGVEQQLDSEDYDTHYNLGIAYKEMGLIDEAIGEFQLASKDPKRAVECASMLGLCFLEKGMPQLAIKWYRKGLEIAEISEDEHIGLLYDLGSAYLEVGDTDNAQKSFMEVYGMNTNYRDIVSRIKQLEDARR